MEEMWKILIIHDITPNQFYLLYSIKDSIATPNINTNLELLHLKAKKWIDDDINLSPEAKDLIREVERFFKKIKKKTNGVVMGEDFEEQIQKYNDTWPVMRLPSNKAARSAIRNLESPFRWFFENYSYTWDQIHKATGFYLDEKEAKNWEYTRTSQYFVRKQLQDKSWESELADYCQMIVDGVLDVEAKKENKPFKDNVF